MKAMAKCKINKHTKTNVHGGQKYCQWWQQGDKQQYKNL